MNRSTNTAPVSLSTSYLIASPCMGISMTTLQSFGTSRPAATRSRLMVRRLYGRAARAPAALGAALFAAAAALGPVAAHAEGAPDGVVAFSTAKAGGALPP